MTNIKLSNKETVGDYTSFEVSVENVNICICKSKDSVQVVIKNASHNAYKGMGKFFNNMNEAIENYKNKKIIAALQFAADFT
jgi:ribosomal protein L31